MKRLAANYSIVIGAVFVATSLVLGFLMFFSESVLGVKFSNISDIHLLSFLTGGLVLLIFGSKSLIAEKKRNKKKRRGEK